MLAAGTRSPLRPSKDGGPDVLLRRQEARRPGGLLGDTGEPEAVIVYTAPINRYFGDKSVELSRLVRLPSVEWSISRFVSWSLRWLRRNTDLLYCLSYADLSAGHHGGIYQACNFIHVMVSKGNRHYRNPLTGQVVSGRSFDQRRPGYRDGWEALRTSPKFLYVYPLSERRGSLLDRFGWRALPYPKPELAIAKEQK